MQTTGGDPLRAPRPGQWRLVDFDGGNGFLGLAGITVAVAIYRLLAAPADEEPAQREPCNGL